MFHTRSSWLTSLIVALATATACSENSSHTANPAVPPSRHIATGREFWLPGAGPNELDVQRAIGRVEHRITPATSERPAYASTSRFEVSFAAAPTVTSAGSNHAAWVELRSVKRGADDLYRADRRASDWQIDGDTAQRALTPEAGIVEHAQVTRAGVELTWVLEQRIGSGDLDLALGIPGWRAARAGDGLRLTRDDSRDALHFGHVDVVDAAGHRSAAVLTAAEDEVRIHVDAAVLDSATWPVAIDPVIGPELALLTPTLVGLADDASGFSVAASTGMYLITWNQGSNVHVARVNTSGVLQDTLPLDLTSEGRVAGTTAASNGTDFLACWSGSPVTCARIRASDGAMLGSPIRLGGISGDTPSVAAAGQTYLVTWRSSNNSLFAARVSAIDGSVFDAVPIALGTQSAEAPAVASNGTDFFITWSDYRSGTSADIYGARILGASGQNRDPTGIPIVTASGNQVSPAVGSDGTDFLVMWADQRSGSTGAFGDWRTTVVRNAGGAVVTPDGTFVDSIRRTPKRPAITSVGGTYVVYWGNQNGSNTSLYSRTFSASGTPIGTNTTMFNATRAIDMAPVVARGMDLFLVYADSLGGTGASLLGRRVRQADLGIVDSAPIRITQTPSMQDVPQVAYTAGTYLVAWWDSRSTWQLIGTRIDAASGSVLDPAGIRLDRGLNQLDTCTLAPGGSNFLVVCASSASGTGNAIQAIRVSAETGQVLDNTPIEIHPPSVYVSNWIEVATNGTTALVTWPDYSLSSYVGRRLSLSGTVLDSTDIALTASTPFQGLQAQFDVASDGTDFLFAWVQRGTNSQLYSSRILANGSKVNAQDVPVTTASGNKQFPHLVFGGGGYMLTWSQRSGNQWLLASSPLGADGTPSVPLGNAIVPTSFSDALAFDGRDFLTTFGLFDANSTYLGTAAYALSAATGQPRSSDPFVLSATGSYSQLACSTASTGRNTCLVAYARPQYGTQRVRVRTVALNTAPTTTAAAMATDEDTPLAVQLQGTDPDGDALTFTITAQPQHGTLTGTPPNLTYVPAANYDGGDGFSFSVSDGTATASGDVTLQVNPVNDPPTAVSNAITLNEDGSAVIDLAATDPESDPLTFQTTPPSHGTLSGTAPHLTYTPAPNYNGTDSFTFTARDRSATSSAATITLTVKPVNDVPVATPLTLDLTEDQPRTFDLAGTDLDGDSLTYAVAQLPTHGLLSGTAPHLTYTPVANFNGTDTFTFTVRDAAATSTAATVTVRIAAVNDAPVAVLAQYSLLEDSSQTFDLGASDADNDALRFVVTANPQHGALSGTPPHLTYTPFPNFNGTDALTFTASDAATDSAPTVITFAVAPVNDAPTATGGQYTLDEDGSIDIALLGADLDGDQLQYAILGTPERGALTGTPPHVTYRPRANLNGTDRFRFRVTDGTLSAEADIELTIRPQPDAPTATAQELATDEDTPLPIVLAGTIVDGTTLTFEVTRAPEHGTLGGTNANVTYTPKPDYAGPDAFEFVASDGNQRSAPATVKLTVRPVNDAPVALAASAATEAGKPVTIALQGTDVDGDAVAFAVVDAPKGGIVSIDGSDATYTPNAGFSGSDTFTFAAKDGRLQSAPASVVVGVKAAPAPPAAASSGCSSTGADMSALALVAAALARWQQRRRRA